MRKSTILDEAENDYHLRMYLGQLSTPLE